MRKDMSRIYMLLPNLAGMISFLIANSSNPYLAAFGHLWVIFLPIGIVNFFLNQDSRNRDRKDIDA